MEFPLEEDINTNMHNLNSNNYKDAIDKKNITQVRKKLETNDNKSKYGPKMKPKKDYNIKRNVDNDKIICFLFSSETKIEDIKIDTKNEIHPFGETIKDEKTFNIYYIEVAFLNSNIKIDVGKNSFF